MNSDSFAFGEKTTKNQRLRIDRFVYSRETIHEIRRNYFWGSDNDTVDIWNINYQQQKTYKRYLTEALGLNPPKRPRSEEWNVQPWPCAPRKKTYLSSAASILDLPSYSYAVFPEILDWSHRNLLVAALGDTYHLFSWREQNVIDRGVSQYNINCCKFSPQGGMLLLGTNFNVIELHDELVKHIRETYCNCDLAPICQITTIDWSPTGKSFVAGCSRGAVSAYDCHGFQTSRWTGLLGSIIKSARVSPDARFVAVSVVKSPIVHILAWPVLMQWSTVSLNHPAIIRTLVWHPWRSALLGIGAVAQGFGTITVLLDASSDRLRQMPFGLYRPYSLDAMLFSHRTGEMVLSLWNSDTTLSEEKISTQLVVMSDPCTVVDQSVVAGRGNSNRIQTMVFSPDGTKLATATVDEDLIIWNFLPEDKKKTNKNKLRKFSSLPVYLDKLSQGFTFR